MKKICCYIVACFIVMSTFSCRHVRDVAYFQGKDSTVNDNRKVVYKNFKKDKDPVQKIQTYEAIIQSNDILSIYVSSLSKEASSFFNEQETSVGASNSFSTRSSMGYLVDVNGYIEMPLIGRVKMGGLTTQSARDTLVRRLENFLQNPSVRIYFENFRVTILGEVNHPGVYNVTNEKLSVPEALGLAGDLTIYGNRKQVMLIREVNGEKNFIKLNLTERDLFYSPYYYLHSNDVLYIEPTKDKISLSDNVYRIIPLLITSTTLLVVVLARFVQ